MKDSPNSKKERRKRGHRSGSRGSQEGSNERPENQMDTKSHGHYPSQNPNNLSVADKKYSKSFVDTRKTKPCSAQDSDNEHIEHN